MFNYSEKELAVIDQQLDPLLASAAEQGIEAQQLALDATRLLSCTEDRLSDYKNRGFFKRCWSKLSGKTSALERANVNDLIEMQRIGWRYLIMLQERDLLLAHSIVTVKNNLLTLAVKEEETRRSIIDLAERISSRFSVLEDRVGKLEVATNIHSWLLTLDTFDYDEKFPPYIRLLRVVRDFYQLKAGDWNLQEIKYLQKAVKEVGLQPKSKVTIEEFLNCLLDEIEQESVDSFRNLICLPAGESGELIPSRFVLDEIAVPFYASLARIEEDYTDCLRTIEVLADRLNISVQEAHRETLMAFVKKDGIDTSVAIPLRDLAVELLACMGMTAKLYNPKEYESHGAKDFSARVDANKISEDKQGHKSGFDRFVENISNGLIEDKVSGLYWVVGPDSGTNWDDAKKWAESLGEGWRMPTRTELRGLWDAGISRGNWGPFENSGLWVWSGEVRSGSSYWRFGFDGRIDACNPGDFPSTTRGFAVHSRVDSQSRGTSKGTLRDSFMNNRFLRNTSSGIIEDTDTGLGWLIGPSEDISQTQAKEWIQSIGKEWRFPTIKELRNLYHAGVKVSKWKLKWPAPFESLTGGEAIWSCELEPQIPSSPTAFSFGVGQEGWANGSQSEGFRCIAVRKL